MSFADLGLSDPILRAVTEKGYETPSPIQAQAIPAVLAGRDVMAAAQTGTGKTAGFTLPILELLSRGERANANQVRALVLTPTRELAAQVGESVADYGKYLPMRSCVVFGGVKINPQMMALRKGADVLIATPGRLLDLYNQNAVRFTQLEVLVLDEADRMLDMGFIHDIKKILALLPAKRQNLLFSATFSEDIRALAKGLIHNPVEVSVAPANSTTKAVEQFVIPLDKSRKTSALIKLVKDGNWQQALVFTRTKHGANRLTQLLEKAGITASAIHGNKSQGARTKALADFKAGNIRLLVATDIAARGLDIDQLPHVVNYELPNVAEDYVHRIGRTGRAGATGEAYSLVSADEFKQLADIERLTRQVITRQVLEGLEASNEVPESRLDTRGPKKPKKPKKPKVHLDDQSSAEQAQRPSREKPAQGNKPRHGGGENPAARRGNGEKPNGQRSGTRPSGNKSAGPQKNTPSGNKPTAKKPAKRPAGNGQSRRPANEA